MIARDYPRERRDMVRKEVAGKGVTDEAVVRVMEKVPRHLFVPLEMEREAYSGSALPIGNGQTISAPQMVGIMTQALRLTGTETVLEIGTGSGYQAAILSALAARVITVERLESLAEIARTRLADLGVTNVEVVAADGSPGLPERAPFDRILVTAATPRISEGLLEQLGTKGILVAPVGERETQDLKRFIRQTRDFYEETICRCVFVPLLGREGFQEE